MSHATYIPVTDTTLAIITQSNETLDLSPGITPMSEVLGLTALQGLPLDADDPGEMIETVLIKLFEMWNECRLQTPKALGTFEDQLYAQLDAELLKARIPHMDRWRICTVIPSAIASRQFLTPRGEWDTGFKKSYLGDRYPAETVVGVHATATGHYTDSQYRVLNRISGNRDDHANIHGNAGTGKTHVIEGCLDVWENQGLKPYNILILVQHITQVQSLKFRLPKPYHRQIITFGQFAARVLPDEYKRFNSQETGNKPINQKALVARYGLQALAGMSATEILDNILMTVRKYCMSTEQSITDRHLPRGLQRRTQGGYADNRVLRGLVLTKAHQVWLDLFDLTAIDPLPMPIYPYHRTKLATILGCTIAPYIKRLVVDESHDLSLAMNKIIHDSPHVACITLGDGFQNLGGTYVDLSRDITTLDLGRSYRSGRALEALVKPIISKHIFVPPEEFRGSADIYTEINYYKTPQIPEKPTGILVSDLWALWVWMQYIADHNAPFTLIGSSYVLINFAEAVMGLKAGQRSRNRALSMYSTWQHLAADLYPKNLAFKTVSDWLDKGYGMNELRLAFRHYQESLYTGKKPTIHVLGLAEHSKNHEFDRIYLTPDIVSIIEGEKSLSEVRASIQRSILYVASTRGKHEVNAPIQLREWIEEISGH